MKSIPKFISRSIGLLILSILLLLIANVILAVFIFQQQFSGEASYSSSPYRYTQNIASHITKNDNSYALNEQAAEKLKTDHVWGIIVDEDSRSTVWQTDNLPENIPQAYSLADISDLTLGYIKGYPTYTSEVDQGLLVLGFPKTSYWKMMTPTWTYQFITNLPQILLVVLTVNLIVVLFLYLWFSGRMVRSVAPLVEGIKNLPKGTHKKIREKGPLSEVAENINQTSKVLEEQEKQLSKKEEARADWIAGISHDIRTPLSMVVGYASQLADNSSLSAEEKDKAKIIVNQSQKIKSLVNDLNLSSKLEYSMQAMNIQKVELTSFLRKVIVEFINNDLEKNYSIHWQTDKIPDTIFLQADVELLKRAITNLLQNAINHNLDGCNIYVSIKQEDHTVSIIVEDDGVGVSETQLNKLNHSSHYMISKDENLNQGHGLGLLIVRQIIESHDGNVFLEKSKYEGLSVQITVPKITSF
ncbi:sensor histidine kinase [Tetragenococcus halophilus]|uniref:histidine kinase n=1 Tax=Tetragenococcus halophilus TaxID=51669 RepID=A0A3G5FII7_TETHA|nr:HAMP domain-containing sensor histidine kinase [Tetragenococcus halophilus]MDN6270770.1 HAMP domain-containing histidine kinase [Tetragenococcus koreensis]MDN6836218.1 HAMP domain-containing histidine kinase [Lactococcus lactis]AYW49938.1 sensor histidine kinase [Tetragenococcus halophilus]MDN6141926.1 HAMP domain-containing histidine kinase [Tetragenococcus halophilus]MDN6143000.1 HAMP domain-containing histidine kinase [Tetragenococcus halophilus]